MMSKALQKEYFLLLLPLFFVLHGYVEFFPAVPVLGAVMLFGKYVLAFAVVLLVMYLFYQNFRKAAMMALVLMLLFFFFGAVHDALKNLTFLPFLAKYSVLLPLIAIAAVAAAVLVKRSRFSFNRPVSFLNLLLILLCVLDLVVLATKPNRNEHRAVSGNAIVKCDTCSKPDIYLIISDEYAGKESLQTLFNHDNTPFEDALKQKGFTVLKNTTSNYNFTPFSIASMLSMNYLHNIGNVANEKNALTRALNTIDNNATVDVLKQHGYDIKNYSYFSLAGQPSLTEQSLLTTREGLISGQTLFSRLYRDLGYHLMTTLRWKRFTKQITETDYRNNELLMQKTIDEAQRPSTSPKFVYTHLMMPHYPYFTDSTGKLNPVDKITEGNQANMQLYLGYLKYTNGVLLQLVDKLQAAVPPNTVIMLMSDHGYREYPREIDRRFEFLNLNATYGLADSTLIKSSVNQFRRLFNSILGQNYPFLQDSTFYLVEK